MRKDANLNNQDLQHWYKTPYEMEFTNTGFPILESCNLNIPRRGIKTLPFNYAMSTKDYNRFIHFYIQDFLFNRIWNNPLKYIEILKKFDGIVMPDFSMYTDMPVILQKYSKYKSQWFARMCQLEGIEVIPNIIYTDYDSYEWCFDGLPANSVYMISSIGCTQTADKEVTDYFYTGFKKSLEVLRPRLVLLRTTTKMYNKIINIVDDGVTEFRVVPYIFR